MPTRARVQVGQREERVAEGRGEEKLPDEDEPRETRREAEHIVYAHTKHAGMEQRCASEKPRTGKRHTVVRCLGFVSKTYVGGREEGGRHR